MSPVRIEHVPEGWSQNAQRAVAFWFDQHKHPTYRDVFGKTIFERGRPYWSYVERPANGAAMPMPVGELIPVGWVAPFYPPQNYMNLSVGRVHDDGQWLSPMQYNQYLKVDWPRMAKDDAEAMQTYYKRAMHEAGRINEPPPRYGQPLSWTLRTLCGPPPRSPKIAEAAMAGDHWILGQVMPVWNPTHSRWDVKENEELARLVRMHQESVMSPEEAMQAEARYKEEQARVGELTDQVRMLHERLEQMAKDNEEDRLRRAKHGRKGGPRPATTE